MTEAEVIEQAADRIERDQPALAPVARAFRGLLVSRARIKASLPQPREPALPPPDRERLSQGMPALTAEGLAGLMDPWGETVAMTIVALGQAFPGVAADSRRLHESLDRGEADLGRCVEALTRDDQEEMEKTAARLGLRPPVLRFLLAQMLKPFVEKKTEPLHAPVRNLPWHRGYCPICGSFPEITFLQGEGQRWLRCSLCGCEWQFDRMLCPHCEAQGDKKKDLIYVDGRRDEFADLCAGCRRYVVGIDLRERKEESINPASALGLLHLDIIAQQKGYSPVAPCAWNMVGPAGQDSEETSVER